MTAIRQIMERLLPDEEAKLHLKNRTPAGLTIHRPAAASPARICAKICPPEEK